MVAGKSAWVLFECFVTLPPPPEVGKILYGPTRALIWGGGCRVSCSWGLWARGPRGRRGVLGRGLLRLRQAEREAVSCARGARQRQPILPTCIHCPACRCLLLLTPAACGTLPLIPRALDTESAGSSYATGFVVDKVRRWVGGQVGGWASALLGPAGGWLLAFLMLHGTHWPPLPTSPSSH